MSMDARNLALFLKERELAKEVESGTLACSYEVLADRDSVLGAMRGFGGQGWVAYTDRVVERLTAGELSVDDYVLFAEFVNGARSLHVQCLGEEWRLDTIERVEGEGMLLRERRMAIGGGFLHYEVHWSLERSATLPCWRPSAARFVGFKGED